MHQVRLATLKKTTGLRWWQGEASHAGPVDIVVLRTMRLIKVSCVGWFLKARKISAAYAIIIPVCIRKANYPRPSQEGFLRARGETILSRENRSTSLENQEAGIAAAKSSRIGGDGSLPSLSTVYLPWLTKAPAAATVSFAQLGPGFPA
jgi:hypothetical protein